MTFDTKNGTRGARQPAKRLMNLVNAFNIRRIRGKGGKIMGLDALVLTTIGRKTGEQRATPVAWFPDSDHSWLIVASANGAANNPAWYYNLKANPDKARIQIASRTIDVTAEQLSGNDRKSAWRQITDLAPRFNNYEKHTDRDIPVIRLRQRPSKIHQ